jgi:arsenate reductase
MVTLYGIKNCDTVRKAKKYLESRNIAFTFVDFRETPIDKTTLLQWGGQVGIDTLFNNRSTTYRNLKLKELNLNEDEKYDWLAKKNTLIKRPILNDNGKITVGFKEEEYKKYFG